MRGREVEPGCVEGGDNMGVEFWRSGCFGGRTVEQTDLVASSSGITQGYARLTDVCLKLQLQDIF